ncbi:MAG: hypothetical protein ACRYHQ_20350, partial [Janthinobacterium lividum]
MRMQLAIVTGLIASAWLGNAAQAQTLHQKQVMTEQQQKLDLTVTGPQTVNGNCGTSITAKFDWQSFVAADALEKSVPGTEGPAAWCARPLDAVARMCGPDAGSGRAANKSAISAKIKTYACSYAPGQPQSLDLDPSGTLTYRGDYTAVGAEPFVT